MPQYKEKERKTLETKKKKKFKLFDMNRDGPGVEKGEDTTPNLKYFFKLWGRKFWRLISLNLLMLVQVLPLVVAVYLHMTAPKNPTQYFPLYAPMLGAQTALPTAAGATLFSGASGLLREITVFNSPIYWIIGILLVLHVATYGWQKAGTTYILRNMVRGDGVFLLSDYFYAICRNWKQALGMGILDCVVIGVLFFDFNYFYGMPPSMGTNFMYVMTIALILIYVIMRFYMYTMMVTFDMKLSKILKNALIFTALGIKRNLLALLGITALTAVSAALIVLGIQISFPAIIIIPVLYLLAFCGFIYTYAVYPVIKKYMIDPVAPPPLP